MIETSQFQTLVAVAKTDSFSRAADILGVTQSAISQSIKNLENKLEVTVFNRIGKKVVLTPEGEKLLALGSNFLQQMERTLENIKHDKSSMSGQVRIGTLTGVGKSWLAPELLDAASEYPDLIINLSLGVPVDLVRDFSEHKLDFLILPEYDLPLIGEKALLGEEKSTLVFPKGPGFDIDENITFEKLTSYPTILFDREAPIYLKWCQKRFGELPDKINCRYIINSYGNMLQAVLRGLGVAILPTHVLRRWYYRDKVGTLGQDFEVTNAKFYLVYHKSSCELIRIQKMIERLIKSDNPLSVGS